MSRRPGNVSFPKTENKSIFEERALVGKRWQACGRPRSTGAMPAGRPSGVTAPPRDPHGDRSSVRPKKSRPMTILLDDVFCSPGVELVNVKIIDITSA